jgi:hypothetical protein
LPADRVVGQFAFLVLFTPRLQPGVKANSEIGNRFNGFL